MAEEAVVATPDVVGKSAQFTDALAQIGSELYGNIVKFIPNLLAAIILVLLGWVVSMLVARIMKKLLDVIGLEKFLAEHRVEDALGNVKISKVLVQLVKYTVILLFLREAVWFIYLGQVTDFLTSVINYMPNVIGAVVIIVIAAIIGELLKEKILEVHEKEEYMKLLANGAKYLAVFFGVVMSLDALGFPTMILRDTFNIFLGTIGAAVALAVGLAFGFGGQETAKEMVKEWRKHIHS